MKAHHPSIGIFGLAVAVMLAGPGFASDTEAGTSSSWQVIAGDYSKGNPVTRLELLTPDSPRKGNQPVRPVSATETADSGDLASTAEQGEADPEAAVTDPETVVKPLADEASQELAEGGRYGLLKLGEEVLRIDREAGTVSFCSKRNELWRCMPAPLAEEAYLAEIEALNAQISALNTKIEDLQSAAVPQQGEEQAGSGSQEPAETQGSLSGDEGQDRPDSGAAAAEDENGLSRSDEEDLEEILDFTEMAMRRFFGLMQELRSDFQTGTPSP